MKTRIVEVTVKLFLSQDVDEEEARDIVESMKYSMDYSLIESTEIIADDISERFEKTTQE